jgi:putative N-acetyltransferase (TIGR04045 family)
VSAPAPDAFVCRLARDEAERLAYLALRRQIFCLEQGLFAGDDRDEHDRAAHPIVCLHENARVVGVVRIWETALGDWWGGRLGVDADFRAAAVVGRRLVQTAVGTARTWGAWRFRATVQSTNVAFFRRLHWRTLEELELFGQRHHLMEADLSWYRPTNEARPTSPGLSRESLDAA